MYINKKHTQTDFDTILALVKQNSFGIVTTHGPGGLLATHVPFIVETSSTGNSSTSDDDKDLAKELTLKAHIARVNPQSKHFLALQESGEECMVVFQGSHGYITPQWYTETRATTGKAVPTWDYSAVHLYGTVKLIKDPEWLLEQSAVLTNENEAALAEQWKLSDAPDSYINLLVKAIYGIEIKVTRLDAAWKYSQEHQGKDSEGVIDGLESLGTEAATELAGEVRKATGCPLAS